LFWYFGFDTLLGMHKLHTLKNGLTVITIDLPHLDSVTSLIAVGAGSRYETKQNSGISHFLEHMSFKGSKKYPNHEKLSSIIDGMGAVNNAFTDREVTCYWIKSSSQNITLSTDILSSMMTELLLKQEEIDREKGVIIEEIRMYQDDPARHVWDLYLKLQFGDQPLGWDVIGSETTVNSFNREDFVSFLDAWYKANNMVLVFSGKLPNNILEIAEEKFGKISSGDVEAYQKYQSLTQTKAEIGLLFKETDQAKLILGVEAYDRFHPKRYAARVLSYVLGGGMSSRLFLQVRERRGLAYYVGSVYDHFLDSGYFAVFGGLKIEKLEEGITVIKEELEKVCTEKVGDEELKKVKEMIRGRLAIRKESSNFLAETFAMDYLLDKRIETFEEYLEQIDAVTAEEIQDVAQELFQKNRYNLQIIGPYKDPQPFFKLLNL
jgi:predicted Zn-dependent peptidase